MNVVDNAIILESKITVPEIIPSNPLLTAVINLAYSPRQLHKYYIEIHEIIFHAVF